MDAIDEIHELLKSNGAVLERTKKHHIWRFPDGRIWVLPGSPRSSQSYTNNLCDLRTFLGVKKAKKKSTAPKRKKAKKSPAKVYLSSDEKLAIIRPNRNAAELQKIKTAIAEFTPLRAEGTEYDALPIVQSDSGPSSFAWDAEAAKRYWPPPSLWQRFKSWALKLVRSGK